MGKLQLLKVEVRGAPLISHRTRMGFPGYGARAQAAANPAINAMRSLSKTQGIGIRYHVLLEGIEYTATGRLDDFQGIKLEPSLHPGAFRQSFVDGPVLRRAAELFESVPQLSERLTPVESAEIDFDSLTFSLTPTDAMYCATITAGGNWPSSAPLVPFDEIRINPATVALNYGQGVFEGLKAKRTARGRIALFRPIENSRRLRNGAERIMLTPVSDEIFMDAVTRTVLANEKWIPPRGKGSLYIRPVLIGSGPKVGVAPAPENTLYIYVTPVGPYFKGEITGVDLKVSDKYHRAANGGAGNVKYSGNYAAAMRAAFEIKRDGFDDVIFLDAKTHSYVEEVGASNFFCVVGNVLYTPSLGTILPGITRASVISLAKHLDMQVVEMDVPIQFAMGASEAFCTGTAAAISPIKSLTYKDKTKTFNRGQVGPITLQLSRQLTGIQDETLADPFSWAHPLDA